MKTNQYIFIGLFALFSFTMLVACRTKGETIAKIQVKDINGDPVSAAQVVLYGQSTTSQASVLFDTTSSNAAGEAIFNYDDLYQLGQAGVAVLNIDVQKGTATGSGIIKIEAETTSEETVFVQ